MILFVTSSPNDDDLAKTLGSTAIRCPVPSDVCFWGKFDDEDIPLLVACERKKIGDLAQCILSGRLLHQFQMCKAEGIGVMCLIVEGRVRSNPDDGLLEIPVWGINPRTLRRCEIWQPVKPTLTYSRFDQYLTELDYLLGVIVKRTEDVRETASVIKALWDNFQTPPSKHNSLHTMYEQPNREGVLLMKPGLVRRVAKELNNIGWERSRDVADHFRSVREMVNADAKEWEKIPGIGKGIAKKVVQSLGGEP